MFDPVFSALFLFVFFSPHQKEELVTAKKLLESGSEPLDKVDLNNRMSELQSEMFRLDVNNKKLNSFLDNGSEAST